MAPSKKNCPPTPALPNLTVEDAFNPPKSERFVVVELVGAPKLVPGVNGKALPEPPHAVPVFDMRPIDENVAHPAVPPAEETIKFVVLAVPETERLELVALVKFVLVAKRLVLVAFVEVEVSEVRLKIVEEALERRPPLKLRSVVVAFDGKR